MQWRSVAEPPAQDGPYLVFMPQRSLDRYSVQHWDHVDKWSNDYGITQWAVIDPPGGNQE